MVTDVSKGRGSRIPVCANVKDEHLIIQVNNSETSSQNEAEFSSSPLESRQLKSMSEVRSLTEDGVAKVLSSLKMIEYIDIFKENQINGELLITLDVADFITELKLSIFQAKKLIKYIRGWRPSAVDTESDKTSRRNSLNPRDWTEDDVMIHMNSINLQDFALFCKHNQGNGELLLDILDTDMEKVETLPPADFQLKFSALLENEGPLAEYTNFRQFSKIFC